jgi:membrane protein implicated in regulation of membrane protease activity
VRGNGKARVGDGYWKVRGPDLPAGSAVRVTGVEGTVLIVEAA